MGSTYVQMSSATFIYIYLYAHAYVYIAICTCAGKWENCLPSFFFIIPVHQYPYKRARLRERNARRHEVM